MPHHVFQQPAAEMDGEMKIRVLMQHSEKGPVTTLMCIVEHVLEIAYRLMGMYAQQ